MNFIKQHRTFFIVLAISLVLYFLLVGFWTGFHAKRKIQLHVKNKTGLSIEMGMVYLYPFTGNGFIKNLAIVNPAGFYSKNALSIDEIEFKGTSKTIYSDVTSLQTMKVKGIEINLEVKDLESNFYRLYVDGAKYYRSEGSSVEQGLKTFSISELAIDPITVVIGPKLLAKTITLEAATMDDVGTPEAGVRFYQFGRMLLTTYRPLIERALDDPSAPINTELKTMIRRWVDMGAQGQ